MLQLQTIGNLGADVQTKQNKTTNEEFFTAELAASRTNKGTGEQKSTWIKLVIPAFLKPVTPFLKKGIKIFVQGNLSVENWESQGKTGINIICYVDKLELLTPKEKEAENAAPAENNPPF